MEKKAQLAFHKQVILIGAALFLVCLVVICMCFSFFLLFFCVSYELGWFLVMVLRMLWYCASNYFS